MILISLFIQIHLIDNKMNIKKFMYLMINDIEKHNNIKRSIKLMKIYNHMIAKESIAQSIASVQIN